MADGTPDFTDLLAAFDDPPTVNQNNNPLGYVTSNFQGGQLQFSNLPGQLQVNAIPFGSDQGQSLFAPVNQAAPPQGQLRQISAGVQNASSQNQPYQQHTTQDALQLNMAPAPVVEEPSFSGGSLGSMFLSSVELALSGENTDPYVVKIPPTTARAKKAPKRVRQPSKQPSLPQQQQISQNVNANTSIQLSPFGTVTQPPAQVVVTLQNTVVVNAAQPKTMQVSSPPFVLPNDIQAANAGAQKTFVQSQFMHPTQLTRQQISGPGSNPPRPLSATSSTSDHRPGSVPQPSPSCGSNHSGDPATPLTPQTYNAAVPQNYNAATPQPRSITPQVAGLQQQRAGSYSDISKQLPHKGNSTPGSTSGHTMDLGLTLQQPTKNQALSNPSSSNLQTPLKQILAGNQGLYGNLNEAVSFPDTLGMSATNTQGPQQWFMQGQQQIQTKALSLPPDTQSTPQLNYVLSSNQPYGQTLNALGMPTLPVAPAYFERNESSSGGTGSLTQKQSKLLEQMAASYGNKAKKATSTSQASLTQSGALPPNSNVSFQANRSNDGHALGRVNSSDSNIMMDMMNKASDAGAATVKELFDSHATQYEAISPVSDYAMSPINKTNLTDDSLFGQTKVSDQSNSHTHDDTITDPVLMYIKQDNVTHAASTTSYGTGMMSTGISQGANSFYSSSVHGLLTGDQPSNLKKNDYVGSNLDTRGNSGSTLFSNTLPNMFNLTQPGDVSGSYGSTAASSSWDSHSSISKISNFSSNDIGGHTVAATAKSSLFTGPGQAARDRESFSSVAGDKVEKQSSFGVSRRKSSADKAKFTSVSQVSKGSSLESDFGFESDDDMEPTIRLGKVVGKPPKGTGNKPVLMNKSDASLTSPKQRAVNSNIPDGMRDTLEQMRRLKQQNQLLQQMKQQQAAKANAAVSNSANLQPASQPAALPKQISPKSSISNVLHYQATKEDTKSIPTSQISPVKSRRKPSNDLHVQPAMPSGPQLMQQSTKASAPQTVTPTNWSVSPPQPVRQNRLYTSVSTPDTRVSIASSTEPVKISELKDSPLRYTTSYTKQHHSIQPQIPVCAGLQPPAVLPPAVSHSSLSYLLGRPQASQAAKTVSNAPSQVGIQMAQVPAYVSSFLTTPTNEITTSLPKKNLNHKLPPYTNFATTADVSPVTVSLSQTMMPFPYPNISLAQTFHPHFFPGGPMPPFSMSARPAHISASKSDNTVKSTSTIATGHLDLDWLPPETDTSLKTVAAPQMSFPPVSIVNSLRTTSSITMTSSTSGIPKPSFYSPKTESSLPQKPEPGKTFDQPPPCTKAETLQTPTTKPVPITEAPVVHHEPKHHYGKKHRILEGSYPNSSELHYKYGQTAASQVTSTHVTLSQTNGIVAHSVLDKQRRYSKEHNVAKYRKPHHGILDAKSTPASAQMQTTALNLTPTSAVAKVSEMPNAGEKAEQKLPVSDSLKKTDDQAGSMLSLFNSLLKEASNDSLKTSLKTTDEKEKPELEMPTNGTAAALPPVQPATGKPAPAPAQSSVSVPSAVTATPTTAPTVATQPTVPVQKTIAKKRPAATVPFKRRPYPAFDDTTPASILSVPKVVPVATCAVSSVITTVSKPVAANQVQPPKSMPPVIPIASKVVTSKENIAAAPQVAVTCVLAPVAVNDTEPSEVPATLEAAKESPGKSSTGLPKLRITAFRSSGGQVIHQASMIGGGENAETEERSHRHKHLKKKKKKKRRRKRHSSSDYDSVSSLTSMSSFEPASKNLPDIKKVTDRESVSVPKNDVLTTVVGTKPAPKRKRANAASKDTEKKKPAATKRAKVTKESTKKKSDSKSKEPVARYQPKSAFNVGSSVSGATHAPKVIMSLPSTFKRAPGSLPMYLNTSESKSTTVPTIQLVARNTKLLENMVDKSSPGKVVSIKISTPQANKGIPAQVLTNAGLQYLVSTTKPAQRIILPNMSTSVPIPIVSPITGKTLQKNLVPVPAGTPVSSPAGKKSISVGEKIRVFGGKFLETNKTAGPILSISTKNKALSTPLPVFDSFTKSTISGTSTSQGRAATITVSVLQTSSSIATAAAKIMPQISSPNSFQSTFSKLISGQNPVPKYCPPNPPENLNMDMSGHTYHQCLECKDSFMFQNSLVDHYERRSIMIKVRCMQCNESLLFLNKCKLLKHARQHSDKGGGMQFNNAHISPLPLSMCKPRSKESFLNASGASSAEKRRSTTSSEDDLSSSVGNSIMACTDCNFVASTAEALEEHFQQQTTPASPEAGTSGATSSVQASNFTCDMCNLALPNRCSFMAHMRMHKRIAPHTCPECGQTFDYDGKDMDFNLHLSIQCFHLSRMSCYKCRLCSTIFKNADLLRRHLEVRHLQTFYKCRDCPMAFKTLENINSHQRSAHGVVMTTKMIHKCPLCDTVFTDNSPTQQIFLLQKHFEAHINHPSINITAYKCLFCNNIYERKSLLREHLKSVHDVTSSAETSGSRDLSNEINNAKLLLSIEKKSKGINGAATKKAGRKRSLNDAASGREVPSKLQKTLSGGKSVEEANSRIASGILGEGPSKKSGLGGSGGMKHTRQPVKLRLKGMTGNSSISIKVGGGAADGSDSGTLPGAASDLEGRIEVVMTEDGRKMFSCKECGKEFPSQNTCINHMRIKHEGIRTLYCCPHCPVDTIKFAKRISLKKHLKRVHNLTEIRKQDIRLVYAHVPPVPEGQRFDPSNLVLDNGKIISQTKG